MDRTLWPASVLHVEVVCYHSMLHKVSISNTMIWNSHGDKDGSKVTTVVATPGQGPDRPQEVSYTDTKVIGNGSFGVVYQAKLCDSGEMVASRRSCKTRGLR
ncbi:hypothetical protein F7725_002006 [Dissostichus mawsoni]|uniref:Protein kinase domain-containing protein n=1 Tax=Dissostichus mawsoni TaxID=36200 RepID=A0A7J5Y3C1_DISMA|nr:hypothetical protein F7725_002006 [Dissostichus mawsoni]